jgi:hypothetical protein
MRLVLLGAGILLVAIILDLRARPVPPPRDSPRAGQAPVAYERSVGQTHGDTQVASMLRDRPAMALLVARGDSLWEWTAARFDGLGTGFHVFWNPDSPRSSTSDCKWPHVAGEVGYIRVAPVVGVDDELAFQALWSRAVFELLNLEGWRGYAAVYREALDGKVSLEKWIERNTRVEHSTIDRMKEFYASTLEPWARRRNVGVRLGLWKVNHSSSYEEWIADYARSQYPRVPWGEYYEKSIRPYLERRGLRR